MRKLTIRWITRGGGSRNNTAIYCRAAFRYKPEPGARYSNLGFRPAFRL